MTEAERAEYLSAHLKAAWGSMQDWEEWILTNIYHDELPTEEQFRTTFFMSFGIEPTPEEYEHLKNVQGSVD